jgi:hypothetical protein
MKSHNVCRNMLINQTDWPIDPKKCNCVQSDIKLIHSHHRHRARNGEVTVAVVTCELRYLHKSYSDKTLYDFSQDFYEVTWNWTLPVSNWLLQVKIMKESYLKINTCFEFTIVVKPTREIRSDITQIPKVHINVKETGVVNLSTH